MGGIEYPLKVQETNKFEQPKVDASVNVFGYDKNKSFLMRIAVKKERAHCVNYSFRTFKNI